MTDHLPAVTDIEPELAEIVESGDLSAVSQRLGFAKGKLEALIASDPEAIDLIKAARAEYQVFLTMKAELMADEALDTLSKAMQGKIADRKATSAVRAADSILDRTLMPKVTRQSLQVRTEKPARALPDVAELLENAGSDDEAHDIWRDEIGLPGERITRLGAKPNFWPSNAPADGPNGPCGPSDRQRMRGNSLHNNVLSY